MSSPPPSTPQYDTIQAPYDLIRQKTIARIEHENVQTTLAPLIANARVLELACGSGFYTHDLAKWAPAPSSASISRPL